MTDKELSKNGIVTQRGIYISLNPPVLNVPLKDNPEKPKPYWLYTIFLSYILPNGVLSDKVQRIRIDKETHEDLLELFGDWTLEEQRLLFFGIFGSRHKKGIIKKGKLKFVDITNEIRWEKRRRRKNE